MTTETAMQPLPWEEGCPKCGRETLDVATQADGNVRHDAIVQCRHCNWNGRAWFDLSEMGVA